MSKSPANCDYEAKIQKQMMGQADQGYKLQKPNSVWGIKNLETWLVISLLALKSRLILKHSNVVFLQSKSQQAKGEETSDIKKKRNSLYRHDLQT